MSDLEIIGLFWAVFFVLNIVLIWTDYRERKRRKEVEIDTVKEEKGMNAYTAWAIKNGVAIICWTALAIAFSKWWIALFVVLCLSDLKAAPIRKEDSDVH